MTDAIALGEIFITDLNENDFYDPKVDLVTDSNGRTLSSREAAKKLKTILKTLNAPGWKNLSLYWAQEYLNSFREAERLAKLGEVDEVDSQLRSAQDDSNNLPISYDQPRADRLSQQARKSAIDLYLKEARDSAKNGDWRTVLDDLNSIELWDADLRAVGIHFKYDGKQVNSLYQEACEKLAAAAKSEASKASKAGKIAGTKDAIASLSYFSLLAKNRFSLDLSATSQEIEGWMKDAFNAGIPDMFASLQDAAHKGQVMQFHRLLPIFQGFQSEAEQQYGLTFQYTPEMIDNYYQVALIEGIEDNFRLAEAAARQGNKQFAENLMELSQEYVDEYNQRYPKKKALQMDSGRMYEILACAWNQNQCP